MVKRYRRKGKKQTMDRKALSRALMSRGLLNYDSIRFRRVNPPTGYYKLNYSERFVMSAPAITDTAGTKFFRLNSCRDPSLAVGGKTCQGFQNLFGAQGNVVDQLYRRWVVLKTKVRIQFVRDNEQQSNPIYCGVVITADNTNVTNIDRIRGQRNGSRHATIGGLGDDGKATVTTMIDQAKWLNKDVRDDLTYYGTNANEPGDQNYYMAYVANVDASDSDTTVLIDVTSSYYIMVQEPAVLEDGEN